jgi:hypothetical protein
MHGFVASLDLTAAAAAQCNKQGYGLVACSPCSVCIHTQLLLWFELLLSVPQCAVPAYATYQML